MLDFQSIASVISFWTKQASLVEPSPSPSPYLPFCSVQHWFGLPFRSFTTAKRWLFIFMFFFWFSCIRPFFRLSFCFAFFFLSHPVSIRGLSSPLGLCTMHLYVAFIVISGSICWAIQFCSVRNRSRGYSWGRLAHPECSRNRQFFFRSSCSTCVPILLQIFVFAYLAAPSYHVYFRLFLIFRVFSFCFFFLFLFPCFTFSFVFLFPALRNLSYK